MDELLVKGIKLYLGYVTVESTSKKMKVREHYSDVLIVLSLNISV